MAPRPRPTPEAAPPPDTDPRPRRGGALPLLLLLIPIVVYAASFQRPAHDTWTSLAGGRHVALHGVGVEDPFSWASRPPEAGSALIPSGWVNPNWLSQLLLYRVWEVGGGNGLVALKVGLYLAVALLVALAGRVAGAGWALAAATAGVALALGRRFFEIRPQDLGNLCLGLLLVVVAGAAGHPRRAWWLVPLAAIWGNLHGSFALVPLTAAAVLAAGWGRELAGGAVEPPGWWRHWAGSGSAAVAAVVVSSPFHLACLTATMAPTAPEWREVAEWRSPWTLEGGGGHLPALAVALLVWTVLALGALRASWRGRRGREAGWGRELAGAPGLLAVLTVAVVLAVTSRRFIAIALLAAAPAAAQGVAAWLRSRGRPGAASARVALVLWALPVAVSVWVAVEVQRVYLGPWPRGATDATPFQRLVVSDSELAGACAFLRENVTGERLFNLWEDGGYLAWCQQPERGGGLPNRVFVDGRAQLAYDGGVIADYLDLLDGGPADPVRRRREAAPWQDQAGGWVHQRLRRDGVWLAVLPATPDGDRLAGWLQALGLWQPVYHGPDGTVVAAVASDGGAALREAVLDRRAGFPDEPSRLTSEGALLLAQGGGGNARRALESALAGFRLRPGFRALVVAAAAAAASPELGGELERALQGYLEGFSGPRLPEESLPALQAAVFAADELARRAAARGAATEATDWQVRSAEIRGHMLDVYWRTRW